MKMNLKTENIKDEIEEIIRPFIEKLAKREEVLSIILLGGLGKRDFLDQFSDVDLSIITSVKCKDKFPLPFEFHYQHESRNIEFNIHQLILEDELNPENVWNEGKIEAYANAIIIYDPNSYAKQILNNKVIFDEKKAYNRLIWIIQQYRWRGQIHSLRAFERGYPASSHDLLNHCVELLLEAVYLLNKRYLPHRKWIFVFLEQMNIDTRLIKLFEKAMLVKDFSLDSIKERIKTLDEIYEIVTKLVYEIYPDFPVNPYEYYYRNFIQLNNETASDKQFFKQTTRKFVAGKSNEDEKIFGEICFNMQEV